MRVRSVIKWAARLTLLPAAFLLLVVAQSHWEPGTDEWVMEAGLIETPESLSDKERLLFGDGIEMDDFKTLGDSSEWGRLVYANYVLDRLFRYDGVLSQESRDLRDAWNERGMTPSKALLICDRGEQLDPDNAFYNYTKAAIIVSAYGVISESEPFWVATEEAKLETLDGTRYRQVMDEFIRGTGKPFYTTREKDVLRTKLSLLGPPSDLTALLTRVYAQLNDTAACTEMMDRLRRHAARYAHQQLEQGNKAESREIAGRLCIPVLQLGSQAETLMETLISESDYLESLKSRSELYKALGDESQELSLEAQLSNAQASFNELRLRHSSNSGAMDDYLRESGSVLGNILLSIYDDVTESSPVKKQIDAMRTLEQARLDVEAYLVLLKLICGIIAILALVVGVDSIRWRGRKRRGRIYFVGWAKLGTVLGFCVLLPIALFAVYTHRTPFAGREFGVEYRAGRFMAEGVLLSSIIIVLMVHFSGRAALSRCREAGISVPSRSFILGRPALFLALGLLLAGGLTLCVLWSFSPPPIFQQGGLFQSPDPSGLDSHSLEWILGLHGVLAVYVLAFLIRLWTIKTGDPRFGPTVIRSLIPILAAAVIVVGGLTGFALRQAETVFAQAAWSDGGGSMLDESRLPYIKESRQYFQKKLDEEPMP